MIHRASANLLKRPDPVAGKQEFVVGIVGYGRFGQLAAHFIAKKTGVLVYDTRKISILSQSANIKKASLREVASRPVVILAVPVSALEKTLRSIKPLIPQKNNPCIVIDVCSVKAKPIQWMERILPENVQILATHPLFGPDSAKESLHGHRIYVIPVRISGRTFRLVTDVLMAAGLIVDETSPRKHDMMIAETLFLTQYVGRLAGAAKLALRKNATTSYTDLMKIVKIADNDTRELFRDMLKYNPFAKEVLRKLILAQRVVLKDLGKR